MAITAEQRQEQEVRRRQQIAKRTANGSYTPPGTTHERVVRKTATGRQPLDKEMPAGWFGDLAISKATGGRSVRPDHPSRKHDVERGPIPEVGDHIHSVPGRFSYNGHEILWQPRRRERRHPGGNRKLGRRLNDTYLAMTA